MLVGRADAGMRKKKELTGTSGIIPVGSFKKRVIDQIKEFFEDQARLLSGIQKRRL
jgi:hypothetical protein